MSWDQWHEYGIGFDTALVEAKKIRSFILKHKETIKKNIKSDPYNTGRRDAALDKMLEYLKQTTKLDRDDIDEYADKLWDRGCAGLIAMIIIEETGITVYAPGLTDESEDYVLFSAAYPWRYNEKERHLTEDSLIAILEPYADELGVEVEDDVDLIYAG